MEAILNVKHTQKTLYDDDTCNNQMNFYESHTRTFHTRTCAQGLEDFIKQGSHISAHKSLSDVRPPNSDLLPALTLTVDSAKAKFF